MTPDPVNRDAPPLRGPVISTQDWRDLTFLHWAVEPSLVGGCVAWGTGRPAGSW